MSGYIDEVRVNGHLAVKSDNLKIDIYINDEQGSDYDRGYEVSIHIDTTETRKTPKSVYAKLSYPSTYMSVDLGKVVLIACTKVTGRVRSDKPDFSVDGKQRLLNAIVESLSDEKDVRVVERGEDRG